MQHDHKVEFPQLERLKMHVRKHKREYIAGIGGAALATITCVIMKDRIETLLLSRVYGLKTAEISATNRSFFSFNSQQSNIVIRQEIGRPPYLIHDLTTDLYYGSQRMAAKALDVSETTMSRHLNGLRDHVSGHVLERVEVEVAA